MNARHRFLVLGLDGGTFDLFDPLMEAGELPFLRSLLHRGVAAPLTSVYPSKTIPAWYSFATGLDPGSLGIFGFTEPDGGPGKSRLVQSFRPAEAVWDHLSRRGIRVGVVNFPLRAGYPINGFLVPGMFGEAPPTYPTDLRPRLEQAMGAPIITELPAYSDVERAEWMKLATRAVAQRADSTEFLIDEFHPDFLFVLFRETDRVEHQHWAECSTGIGLMGADLREFWRSVDRACERIDKAFRAQGEPAVTLVISDHGHGPVRSVFFTNRWLQREGFLRFRNGGTPLRRRVASRLLLTAGHVPVARHLLRVLADGMRGSGDRPGIVHRLAGDATFERMAGSIDWDSTVAFSYPVPEGIYLNPYRPDLTPERGRAVLRDIRARLEAYREARFEVLEPTKIYREVATARAPGLLLRANGMETELRMDFNYPDPLLAHRPDFFYGTGVHRMNGILIGFGNGSTHERRTSGFSLLDVAPTILEGMGVAPPSVMAGRSFASWLGTAGI